MTILFYLLLASTPFVGIGSFMWARRNKKRSDVDRLND